MSEDSTEAKDGAARKPMGLIGAALPTIITSVLAAIGTIGVASMSGFFDVRKTDAAAQGTITLEKLKFSNDLVKTALASNNPGNSLLFYADIGLLEGLNNGKVKEYANNENKRLATGGDGKSVLPSFDKSARPTLWLDRDFITAFAPNAKSEIADALVSTGNYLLLGFGINSSAKRLSMFLGQIAHETNGLSLLDEEKANYSKSRLMATWPTRFDDQRATEYANKPERILNYVYSGRLGNGDEASGDGWKYRGRGLMQIVGRSNYDQLSKESGVDLIANPDIMANPHVAMLIAAAYWYNKDINKLADEDDIVGVTRKVVGGTSGLESRKKYTELAFKLLTDKATSTPSSAARK
jgi:putative chitinase